MAAESEFFVVTSIPTFLFHLLFDCNRQYMNSTHQSKIVFYAFLSATIAHSIWCFIFIIYLDLGIVGAAFANLIHAFTCFIVTQLYLSFYSASPISFLNFLPDTFSRDKVTSYLAIGLPSILLICLEWWGIEILVLMSGVFSSTAVAA